MDAVVHAIQNLNSYAQLKDKLEESLHVIKSCTVLPKAIAHLEYNMQKHTMGICYLLFCSKSDQNTNEYVKHVEAFLKAIDPNQIRHFCSDRFSAVVHEYVRVLRNHKCPQRAISILSEVIKRLRESPEQITSVHSDFVLICLLSKNYKAACDRLSEPIFEVSPSVGVTPRDFMLYYYYGALVWMNLKNWNKAVDFLQTVLTVPCANQAFISAIMVESYKKYIICSLIAKGKGDILPKQCSTTVQRLIKKFVPEYIEFATAYESRDISKMKEAFGKHKAIFAQDRHLGLLQQAFWKFLEQSIQRLTSTYITLSLADIAATVPGITSARHAELILFRMIQSGDLAASINQKDGMVAFHDVSNVTALAESVDHEIQEVQRVIQRLDSVNESIQCSNEFIKQRIFGILQ